MANVYASSGQVVGTVVHLRLEHSGTVGEHYSLLRDLGGAPVGLGDGGVADPPPAPRGACMVTTVAGAACACSVDQS